MFNNRYFELFFTDPQFQARLILSALLMGVGLWQWQTMHYQNTHLAEIMASRNVLARLERMHNNLPVQPLPEAPKVVKPKMNHNLQGITNSEKGYIALIDGEVYKEGDVIGGFSVRTISENSATLVHAKSGGIYKMRFSSF